MKRVRRIFLNTLTAISLLLAIVFFYRCLCFQERVAYTTTHRYFAIRTNPGTLTFEYHHYPVSPFEPGWHVWHSAWDSPWGKWRGYFGLEREAFIIGMNQPPDYSIQDKSLWLNTGWTLNIPLWGIVLLSLCISFWRVLISLREFKRSTPGHCPACGYDTRANPAKCSECGQEPRAAS